jgi:hypothetical protein
MARSSHGSRQATTWAVAQTQKPMPHMVRLGRAANDNARRIRFQAPLLAVPLLAVAVAVAFTLFALYDWRLF